MDYSLTLSQADVILILNALGELPLKASLQTFGKVQSQMQAIDQANAMKLVPNDGNQK